MKLDVAMRLKAYLNGIGEYGRLEINLAVMFLKI